MKSINILITILLLSFIFSLTACSTNENIQDTQVIEETSTPAPTQAPTPEPTAEPTPVPTPEPTPDPTATPAPTEEPRIYPNVEHALMWVTKEVPVYSDQNRTSQIELAYYDKSYTILRETDNNMFEIKLGETETGFIDCNYCMINLPDYLGPMCNYDIANSYNSIYTAHGYDIPELSNIVLWGYEYVCRDEGEYLVPLLYPTAKLLAQAAQNTLNDGYRLKIYDSFRPNIATRNGYDVMASHMYDEIPEVATSYYNFITDGGNYALSNFLAKSASRHNYGVALDLTLEKVDTDEELQMQTPMHDLTHYSALVNNNDNANLLAKYMKGVGFNSLFSEWWHFQSDKDFNAFGSLRTSGVLINGWVWNHGEWVYISDYDR